MCMSICHNVLESLKLQRFIGILAIYFNQIALYHGVTQGDNSEIFETNDVTELET